MTEQKYARTHSLALRRAPGRRRIRLTACVCFPQIILELEDSLLTYSPHAHPPSSFMFSLKTLLTVKMEYSEYPRYIHRLSPVQMRADSEETHTQLKVLTESFASLSEAVELESKHTRQKLQRMEDRMQEVHIEMAADLKAVLAQLTAAAQATAAAR